MQEQTRKNLAIFEQAMSMWTPFGHGTGTEGKAEDTNTATPDNPKPAEQTPTGKSELDELKSQLATMQQQIEKLARDRS
jgi:polyhydroxyalkanoate synthesis regulator protein